MFLILVIQTVDKNLMMKRTMHFQNNLNEMYSEYKNIASNSF